jgi:hypothetical protein
MEAAPDGTFGVTDALHQTTWGRPSLRVLLTGFGLAVTTVAFMVVRMDINICQAQGSLEGAVGGDQD